MRFLRILLTTIVVLVVVAFIGTVVFLKTLDVSRFKSQITSQISSSLGRDVNIAEITFDFSILKGIILNIHGVTMANDPGAEPANIVEVQRMRMDLDLMAFIRERKILISSISILAPQLVIVRDSSGAINLQKLAKPAAPTSPSEQGAGAAPSAPAAGSSPSGKNNDLLTAVFVKDILVNEGQVTFIDQTFDPPLSAIIRSVDISVSEFSFKDRFAFSFKAALFNYQTNLNVKGYAHIDPANMQVRLDDVLNVINLAQMDRSEVAGVTPLAEVMKLVSDWQGVLEINISQLIANQNGLSVLAGSGQLKDGLIKISQLAKPFENCEINFNFTESLVDVSKSACRLGSGTIRSEAKIKDYMKQGSLEAKLNAEALKLEEIIPDKIFPFPVMGTLKADANVGAAALDPATLVQALRGDSTVNIADGKIMNINLLRVFFDGLSMIPDLMPRINESLPEKYKDILSRDHTVLEKADIGTRIESGKANLTTTDIVADGFSLKAGGSYDLVSGAVSVNGGLAILADLSASMVTAVPELSPLLNDQDEIFIPMAPYQGPVTELKVFPDVAYLAKRIIVGRGKQELQNLIDKALGGDEEDEQSPSSTQEEKPEKKIIGDILDGIFGQ